MGRRLMGPGIPGHIPRERGHSSMEIPAKLAGETKKMRRKPDPSYMKPANLTLRQASIQAEME